MNPILRKFNARALRVDSLLCVGLDPELERIPQRFRTAEFPLFEFNRWIIDQTAQHAAAYKPNSAFYEASGERGWAELKMTLEYLRMTHPDIVTIVDAKRGDNANTNCGYVTAIFDYLNADAVTLHPYLGREALEPFLERTDKSCIILCRTSNEGARELQDLDVGGKPLWLAVAEMVANRWDKEGNCMLVVGATYPREMERIRKSAPRTTFLVPGAGEQGGDVKAVVYAGLDDEGRGLIISSSRAILYSEDPKESACALQQEINSARKQCLAAR